MCCGLSLVVLPERVCCHDDPQGNRWALPRQLANGAMSSSERTRRAWGPCQGVKTQQEWDHTGARTMLPPWVVALGLAPSCGGRCFCWQAALCVVSWHPPPPGRPACACSTCVCRAGMRMHVARRVVTGDSLFRILLRLCPSLDIYNITDFGEKNGDNACEVSGLW